MSKANLVNKEALVEAIKSGEVTNVDDILDEFKSLLKEFYQTAGQVEITEHLGYSKNQKSLNNNYSNG